MTPNMKERDQLLSFRSISSAVGNSAPLVVLLVVGLDEILEGEEGDAGPGDKVTLELPKPQRMLMDHVLAQGKPVIVLNMAGSSIDLRVAQDKAAAILQC